jgi:nucleotide-binding universal stress UspA family protein
MAFKDVLLVMDSYPEPPGEALVEVAADLAQTMGAKISALACAPLLGGAGNPVADFLLDMPNVVIEEGKKSVANAEALLAAFQHAAEARGNFQARLLERFPRPAIQDVFVQYARARDLTIVPIPGRDNVSEISAQFMVSCAETIVFGSGRPVILLPRDRETKGIASLDNVVVAWDGSRPAARAVTDAMPILEIAKKVTVIAVASERSIEFERSGAAIVTNLRRHGAQVEYESADREERDVFDVLQGLIACRRCDLLVMGAFGHSRFREAVFGGTTRAMLKTPPAPLLLAH